MSGDESIDALLVADSVSISFDTPGGVVEVTRDISFSVGAGETVALVGESGSGKTVTAMSVLDLLPPLRAELVPSATAERNSSPRRRSGSVACGADPSA